jgi:hypothetical protein
VLLLSAPLRAQVIIQATAGTSTELSSSGAAFAVHFPNTETDVSGGVADGRAIFGLTEKFKWRGWNWSAGDTQLDWSAGGVGLGVSNRGFTATRKTKTSTLTLFAGGSGNYFGSPYAFGNTISRAGVGAFYQRKMRLLTFSSIDVLNGRQATLVQDVDVHWRGLTASGAAGLLQGQTYFSGIAAYRFHFVNLNAARQHFDYSTVQSEGLGFAFGSFNFHAAAFRSSLAQGETLGIGARVSIFTLESDCFISRYGKFVDGSLTERLGRHWTISQFVSESPRISASGGFSYTGNHFALALGYSQYFMPLYVGRSPFVNAATLTFSIRLPHDSSANIASDLAPNGKIRFTTYAGSYFYGSGTARQDGGGDIGRYVVRGLVEDESGKPISGAAIVAGKQEVWTDGGGQFEIRFRKPKQIILRLDADSFSLGSWQAISLPQRAQPSLNPISIVLLARRSH